MTTTTTDALDDRLDAVVQEARDHVKAFQARAEAEHLGIEERFRKFLPLADRVVAIAREKLGRLTDRLKFDLIPSQMKSDRFYSRSVALDLKTDLAGVAKVRFGLSHDSDVRNVVLDYDLDIIPVFFRFNPHSRLEVPLEGFDESAVAKWLDDRVVEFAETYVELLSTKQHQERALVSDTIAGITFPKYYAAATLDHAGQTYYFISKETRREFAKKNGLNP